MDRGSFGAYGEAIAERYLCAEGYKILARRWRVRHGELDLVVRKGGEVIFVEVKARRTAMFGTPEEAVTNEKAMRIRAAAHAWLSVHAPQQVLFRIDVIAIRRKTDGTLTLRHIRNAVSDD